MGSMGGSYGINRWVCFHHIAPPPQSLLYKKYIEDFTKSGEMHHKAIENFENNVTVYEH